MRAWIAIAAAFGALATLAQAPTPGSIEFVAPHRLATVVGDSVATVAVTPPAGAQIVSVTLTIDGASAGTKSEPPWSFSWSAGDGTAGHVLTAVAAFSDGTEARGSVTTSRLTINETEEVAVVNVYAIARTGKGGYVSDLTSADFKIYENDRPQVIDRFSAERRPLRIAIVLDTSESMRGENLSAAVSSAVEFLSVLARGDEGVVISFSDKVQVLRDLTDKRAELEAAIRTVQASGGTALYDAIVEASKHLAEFDGRRVMLVLSDGRDQAGNGLEPGSLHTLQEAQERALRDEVMVFAIGLGKALASDAKALHANPTAKAIELDFYGRKPLVTILESIAQTTGGAAVFSPSAGQLKRSFEAIANDLRHQYALAYRSDDKRHDGAWREIRVVVGRPGVLVTNRAGYYAPADVPLPRTKAKLRP